MKKEYYILLPILLIITYIPSRIYCDMGLCLANLNTLKCWSPPVSRHSWGRHFLIHTSINVCSYFFFLFLFIFSHTNVTFSKISMFNYNINSLSYWYFKFFILNIKKIIQLTHAADWTHSSRKDKTLVYPILSFHYIYLKTLPRCTPSPCFPSAFFSFSLSPCATRWVNFLLLLLVFGTAIGSSN